MTVRSHGEGGLGPGPHHASKRSPYERLKQAILTGELEPGQPLVESTLAEWYKVSRTPIREALTRLEQDGVVQRSERGLIVRNRSPEEILDIYEARIVLEATVSRVAAERRTEFDVIRLEKAADTLEAIDTSDEATVAGRNWQFHRTVWRASHNESLIDLLNRLDMHLARYPITALTRPRRWETANREHRLLIEAIRDRDGQAASKIATAQFTEARDIRLAIWRESH